MKKKYKVMIGLLAIILICIFVLFLLLGKKKIDEYSISKEDNFYFYVDDQLMEYKGKATLNRDNKVTNLLIKEMKLDAVTEPIYYKNKNKVIFPNSMSIIRPTLGMKQDRINYFTTLEYDDPVVKLSNVDLDMEVSNAFIYDGGNTYFFIDDVKIEYGDQKIDLPALSYIRVGYKDYMYMYNYSTKEMKYYEKIDDIVYAKTANYVINLSTDNLSVGDNSVLLIKNIDKLNNIK